jgi:hypothetical protein
VANDEWRSLILFALYTGQRLGDLAVVLVESRSGQRRSPASNTRKFIANYISVGREALEKAVAAFPEVQG